MPAGNQVLSVDFKVNFMSPARGEKFLASGRVIKPWRTLMVCSGEVLAFQDGNETPVALMQATMMRLPGETLQGKA
jgi:acyl-coenzyme A thioesterase PaaI-like protein